MRTKLLPSYQAFVLAISVGAAMACSIEERPFPNNQTGGEQTGGGGNTGGAGMTGGGGNAGGAGMTGGGGNTGGTAGTGGAPGVCGNGMKEAGEECDDGNAEDSDGCLGTCIMDGGTSCDDAIEVELGLESQKILNGTTVNGGDFPENPDCPSAGRARVYRVTASNHGFLTASLTRSKTNFNSSLYIRNECEGGMTRCAVSMAVTGAMYHGGEVISRPIQDGEDVFVFVDGVTVADEGDYELVLDLSTGEDCDDPVPIRIEAGTEMTFTGSTDHKGTDSDCKDSLLGDAAEDVVYEVTFPKAGAYQILMKADYDSLAYSQTQCGSRDAQIQCDDVPGGSGEILDINVAESGGHVAPGERAYIWMDGAWGADSPYSLTITPPP